MNRFYGRVLCILLIFAFFTLAIENARNASITVDEGLHIASGYTIMVTGDYRIVEEHPPLIKMWMALPLLPLHDLADPTTLPAWDTSDYEATESVPLLRMAQQLLYPHLPVEQWLFPARFMCIIIGILLISLLFRWAADLWGLNGGMLALCLAAFDPNIIAHSAIAGTDIGAAFFMLLSLWVGAKTVKKLTLRNALLTGVTLGLALASKLTAALVVLPLGCLGLLKFVQLSGYPRKNLVKNVILLSVVTFLTLWSVYSFQIGNVPGTTITIPMPAHATPILRLFQHANEGHQAYLLGDNSLDGWWYYFPLAFLVKTPLAVLVLIPLAIGLSIKRRRWFEPPMFVAVLFFVIYSGITLLSPLNIGYRHILPILFVIYLLLGACVKGRKLWVKVLYSTLLFYQAINTMFYSPYLLGWFNVISGGPTHGWRYLADSNTDWGQGFYPLAQFQHTSAIPTFQMAGFVFYDPAIYGLEYTPLTPMHGNTPAVFPSRFAPPPGQYAISLTSLDGIPLADNEMYDWFRWRMPDDKIANSIHYYDVLPEETATYWVAQCTDPVLPLDDDDIIAGFGDREVRRYIPFDCTQTWIIPPLQQGSGVYILHGVHLENNLATKLHFNQPESNDVFIDAYLKSTQINYQQRQYRENPAFGIYRSQTSANSYSPETQAVWIAPAESPPLQPADRVSANTPVEFLGPLDFLGVHHYTKNSVLEVETWWRVNGTIADTNALSIMAHILNESGENIGVADGLGISPDVWSPGDVIIQRHRFTLDNPSSKDAILFRTGLYWLASGDRMTLSRDQGADAIYSALDE